MSAFVLVLQIFQVSLIKKNELNTILKKIYKVIKSSRKKNFMFPLMI